MIILYHLCNIQPSIVAKHKEEKGKRYIIYIHYIAEFNQQPRYIIYSYWGPQKKNYHFYITTKDSSSYKLIKLDQLVLLTNSSMGWPAAWKEIIQFWDYGIEMDGASQVGGSLIGHWYTSTNLIVT